jgi:hypothetical protein
MTDVVRAHFIEERKQPLSVTQASPLGGALRFAVSEHRLSSFFFCNQELKTKILVEQM